MVPQLFWLFSQGHDPARKPGKLVEALQFEFSLTLVGGTDFLNEKNQSVWLRFLSKDRT